MASQVAQSGETHTVAASATRVRHNIWTLDQSDHWHPIIYAYARGVQVLIDRSDADQLDPIGWRYQSDIHGTAVQPDKFRNQCQHFSWYFLPWHRMYLRWFERIIRAAIADLDDVDAQTRSTWALPTGTTAVVTRRTGGCRRPSWTPPCRMAPPRILCGCPDGTSMMVRHCPSPMSIWRARWHLSTSPGSAGLPVAVRDSVMPVKTRVRRWGRWRAPRTEPSTWGWAA